jgi:hypothetical protein
MKNYSLLALNGALGLVLAITLSGCQQHREMMPYFGKWDGGFYVDEAESTRAGFAAPRLGKSSIALKRYTMEGYLMLYATRDSFKLHLEGEQVVIDVDGTWSVTKNSRGEDRISLRPKGFKIDDFGGADMRDPNKAYIPSLDIRDTYGKEILLKPSKDRQKLDGLPMSLGKLVGTHLWKRV